MNEWLLNGPDGTNPLGFLCAVGLLRILHQRARGELPRLAWREVGYWRPVLVLPDGHPDPVDIVMDDLATWRAAPPELNLGGQREGNQSRGGRDLKVPPDVFREFARHAAEAVSPAHRRHADFVAAYGSEISHDRKGQAKPTAFHFTAGNQKFLEIVARLARQMDERHVREALDGPWRYQDQIGVLRWDATGERLHALMAAAPGDEPPPGVAGADWLAFQALPLFPCFPSARGLVTTGFPTGDHAFIWPLWEVPISVGPLRSLLSEPQLAAPHAAWRKARGVSCVLRARVRRIARGYGTFGAAEPVPES